MDLPAGLLAGFAQGAEEGLAILVIPEDRFPMVSPAHQMAEGAGKLNSQRSGHNGQFIPTTTASCSGHYSLSIVRTGRPGGSTDSPGYGFF